MYPKTILIVFFLAFIDPYSVFANEESDEHVPHLKLTKVSNIESFNLLNKKQQHQAEAAIKAFMSIVLSPDSYNKIFQVKNKKSSLPETVNKISTEIRQKVINFANSLGFNKAIQRYKEQSFYDENEFSDNWVDETLYQGIVFSTDLATVVSEICSSLREYFQTLGLNFSPDKYFTSLNYDGMQPFASLNGLSDSSVNFIKCLASQKRKQKSFLKINEIFLNITSGTVDETVNLVKKGLSNFKSKFSMKDSNDNEIQELVCKLITGSGSDQYMDCRKEFKRIKKCMYTFEKYKSGKDRYLTPNWLNEIKYFADCRMQEDKYGDIDVNCKKLERKIPQGTNRQVKFMYQIILGKRLPINSKFNLAINDFSDMLSRSKWSRKFSKNLCRHFIIYQEGLERVNRLANISENDENALIRYKKLSKSLESYKNGLWARLINAGKNLHNLATTLEKYLGDEIRKSRNHGRWWGCEQILEKFGEWLASIMKFFEKNSDKQEDTTSIPTKFPMLSSSDFNSYEQHNSYENFDYRFDYSFHRKVDKKTNSDEKFKELMKSMVNLPKTRDTKSENVLITLANNLLLTAMFMETIGFISALFYIGKSQNINDNAFLQTNITSREVYS